MEYYAHFEGNLYINARCGGEAFPYRSKMCVWGGGKGSYNVVSYVNVQMVGTSGVYSKLIIPLHKI